MSGNLQKLTGKTLKLRVRIGLFKNDSGQRKNFDNIVKIICIYRIYFITAQK